MASFAALFCSGAACADGYADFNAGIALRMRNDDLAIARFTSALADPGLPSALRPVALYDRAMIFGRQNKLQRALDDLDISLKLRPAYDVYLARGSVFEEQDRLEPAVADFAAAIALRPDLLEAHALRLAAYLDHDRFDDGIAEVSALIAMAPRDPVLLGLRSMIYRRTGNFAAALSDADYAIKIASGAASGYDAKVSVLEASGRFDEALETVGKELEYFPDSMFAMLKKGIILWEQKKFADAEKTFADAQAIKPSDGYAAIWRVIAYRSGHSDGAADPAIFAKIDAAAWPGPVADLFRGKDDLAAVIQAAGADPVQKRNRLCEANFYGAQWHYLAGRPAQARVLLDAAVRDCPYDSVERITAVLDRHP